MARHPVFNTPGQTAYYTNSGVPYSTVTNPGDLAAVDKVAQPRENNFVNRDASGTVVTGSHVQGTGTTVDGRKNILWDNEGGEMTGTTGEGIGVIKTTTMPKRHQGYAPPVQDQPFIQFGGTNRIVGGRRMNGSRPQMANRKLHMRETVTSVTEYELVDPRNPFLAKAKETKSVSTYFPEEKVDVFVVGGQSTRPSKKFQVTPLDRSYADPAFAQNTDINHMPYLDGDTRPQMTMLSSKYFQTVSIQDNLLDLAINAVIANNDGTATYTVNWGDGTTSVGVEPVGVLEYDSGTSYSTGDKVIYNGGLYESTASTTGTWTPGNWTLLGTIGVNHTYAASGVYEVVLTNSADANDTKTYTMFMKNASYVPKALAFPSAFMANANPWTVSGRTASIVNLVVEGAPFINVFIDWGDNTGSHQNFEGFRPALETLTQSTFNVAHTYQTAGSYMVKIYAEHLVDGVNSANIYGSNNVPNQSRKQITVLKPVKVQ